MANENLAEKDLESLQQRTIIRLNKEMTKLKTTLQQAGGDVAVVEGTNIATATGVVLPGEAIWFEITLTPAIERLTLWNFYFTVFVGGGGPFEITCRYPFGETLPVGADLLEVYHLPDYISSNDTTGRRKHFVKISNIFGGDPQVISFAGRFYSIKTPAAGA